MKGPTKKERAAVEPDEAWWHARLPPGWKLLGFTYRHSALVDSPTRHSQTIHGDLIDAIRAAERERIIAALPGGYMCDPQAIADMIREMGDD